MSCVLAKPGYPKRHCIKAKKAELVTVYVPKYSTECQVYHEQKCKHVYKTGKQGVGFCRKGNRLNNAEKYLPPSLI